MTPRTAQFVVVALTILGLTAPGAAAHAQLVDPNDPCVVVLFGGNPPGVLGTGSWNSVADVEAAAALLRLTGTSLLSNVREARASAGNEGLSPAALEGLRAINRCLPWMFRMVTRLDEELKRLGRTSVTLPGERQPILVVQLIATIRAQLQQTERLVTETLRPRS